MNRFKIRKFNYIVSRTASSTLYSGPLYSDSKHCIIISLQCPKLRVHPAPGVNISMAGCTILGGMHPVCARFLSHLLLLYIGRVHGVISGCTVLCEVHPASAQNKSLISDTALLNYECIKSCSNIYQVSYIHVLELQ